MWNQVYNPLDNVVLSTIAAAIPVVTLLVLIASGKVKAHIAAIVAVILTNLIAIFIFTMPAGMSIRASLLGDRGRLLPDRLDRAERHFSLPAHGRNRPIRALETRRRRRHRRPPPAAVADRVLLRRVFRRRLGLWHAGRRDRRGSDRARLLTARRLRPVADRQYRACRLWRARYADPGSCDRHRASIPISSAPWSAGNCRCSR